MKWGKVSFWGKVQKRFKDELTNGSERQKRKERVLRKVQARNRIEREKELGTDPYQRRKKRKELGCRERR